MPTNDLTPYIGRRCQLMVDCPACGGTHVREGLIARARTPGDLLIDGFAVTPGDVRALVALPVGDVDGPEVDRRVFNLVVLSGLALAAVSALRLATG